MAEQELNPQVPGEDPAEETAPEANPEPKRRGRPPAVKQEAKHDSIPDQADVDANTIKRAVLTKQGWVVPVSQPVKVS